MSCRILLSALQFGQLKSEKNAIGRRASVSGPNNAPQGSALTATTKASCCGYSEEVVSSPANAPAPADKLPVVSRARNGASLGRSRKVNRDGLDVKRRGNPITQTTTAMAPPARTTRRRHCLRTSVKQSPSICRFEFNLMHFGFQHYGPPNVADVPTDDVFRQRMRHAIRLASEASPPSLPAVVEGLRRAIVTLRMLPHQSLALNVDYSAQNPPIIGWRLATGLRKERLQALNLRFFQPEKVAFDPCSIWANEP
jgi:hypothetical protein